MSLKSPKRHTYAQRTRANTEGARMLAEAFCRKVEYVVDDAGRSVRKWFPDQLQTYKNDDIARAVSRRRAIEYTDLVDDIPPTAVKYAVTKGWLVLAGGLYWVTAKAAIELKLPPKTADGLTIRFLKPVAA